MSVILICAGVALMLGAPIISVLVFLTVGAIGVTVIKALDPDAFP